MEILAPCILPLDKTGLAVIQIMDVYLKICFYS